MGSGGRPKAIWQWVEAKDKYQNSISE